MSSARLSTFQFSLQEQVTTTRSKMFNTIETDKRYQCSSEFGLYRYDSEDDYYSIKKRKSVFGFQYLVVLLTSVIVLSAICLVTYSYISESNRIPRLSNFEDQNITLIPTYFQEASLNDSSNITDLSDSSDYPEPIALELHTIHSTKRNSEDPRPFLYEIRDPKPTGFQYPATEDQSYQAQNINPNRHRAKNIQEIIKLLEESQNNDEAPKKHKKRKGNNRSYIQDPFFPYKPQNPSDINLLATSSFRFAPTIQAGKKKTLEQYPKYETPTQQYNKKNKKQKLNNLYNQNNYFNQQNRFQYPYWNRPYWNDRKQKPFPEQQPMIVHLNLYPKKKKKHDKDQRISESNIHQNCTEEQEQYSQVKNATEFNQLLEKVRHSYQSTSTDTTGTPNDLFRIKNTVLQLHRPDTNQIPKFKYQPNNDQNVEVHKSIGFTIINPNFSSAEQSFESQWRPVAVGHNYFNEENRDNYDLEVGEANENMSDDKNEAVTLPLPNEIFQKYFNTQPTPKYMNDWDLDTVQKNPNLVNHRPAFDDEQE